ncbi:hypothetical protein PENTCL1PPCAC_5310, partial [Pristionchus entomophagus]
TRSSPSPSCCATAAGWTFWTYPPTKSPSFQMTCEQLRTLRVEENCLGKDQFGRHILECPGRDWQATVCLPIRKEETAGRERGSKCPGRDGQATVCLPIRKEETAGRERGSK